ncbi:MAG: hypothetical protein DRO90_00290 [Candidatus Altiarchaeales archaeon]|nr:MAG: hypothetical protein DRO90_00290 [Candidatus Altiarchaeales archaeon]
MGKQKFMNLGLMVILILGIVLISGCVQEQGQTGTPSEKTQTPQTPQATTSKYSPANINLFASAKEGEIIRFYFLLEDANGRNTPGDGHVKVEIFDDLNNSLYYKEFDVKASEFVDYQFKLTGQGIGKAYEWRIPISEIKKGVSSFGFGRAFLTFVTPDGKELHAEDTTVQIPTYTEEELTQMAEEEYNKNAKEVSLELEDDNFKVKIIRYGLFTDYSSFASSESILRVDLEVEAKQTGSFYTYKSKLIDSNGNQYERSYKSKFEGGNLEEGIKRTGYIAFENVPKNIDISKIIIEDYIFDLKNRRAYTYEQLAEEEYNKNAITVNKKIRKGNFEVTVTRGGFFSPYEWGKRKQYFRVDMEVKNVGSRSTYFSPSGMAIIDDQRNQYERSFGGTLDTFSKIYPGVTKKGYVLFEEVPTSVTSVKLVFELGYDENFNPYLFEYNIDLK